MSFNFFSDNSLQFKCTYYRYTVLRKDCCSNSGPVTFKTFFTLHLQSDISVYVSTMTLYNPPNSMLPPNNTQYYSKYSIQCKKKSVQLTHGTSSLGLCFAHGFVLLRALFLHQCCSLSSDLKPCGL